MKASRLRRCSRVAALWLLGTVLLARPAFAAFGAIEWPAASGTVGSSVTVKGYAVDFGGSSGTGVDIVQVYVCPVSCNGSNATLLGQATYGLSRPDIALMYSDNRMTNSG